MNPQNNLYTKEFFWYLYRSQSSHNLYPLEIGTLFCQVGDLTYEFDKIRNACKQCSNYGHGGGCPPRAPDLKSFTSTEDLVWVICCRFWSDFKTKKVANSRNPAIHWKFQDAILARFLANIGYAVCSRIESKFLSTGYCMGCPGKKCNFKVGKNYCRNPKKRTFSMEATGINVVDTVSKLFGFEMHWYSKGKLDVPYMLKCIAIFPRELVDLKILFDILNEFPSCDYMIGSSNYCAKLLELNLE
jgi:predicted metal-binding protein